MGSLNILGPAPWDQRLTCVSGQSCRLQVQGEGSLLTAPVVFEANFTRGSASDGSAQVLFLDTCGVPIGNTNVSEVEVETSITAPGGTCGPIGDSGGIGESRPATKGRSRSTESEEKKKFLRFNRRVIKYTKKKAVCLQSHMSC